MPIDVTKLMNLKNEILEMHNTVDKLIVEITHKTDELQKLCQHPVEVKTETYHAGGYDYVSSVPVTHTCSICNKVLQCYDDPNHKGRHG